MREIEDMANEIMRLLEDFLDNLRILFGIETLSFAESRLDPENF
jgi:hypothetical protein